MKKYVKILLGIGLCSGWIMFGSNLGHHEDSKIQISKKIYTTFHLRNPKMVKKVIEIYDCMIPNRIIEKTEWKNGRIRTKWSYSYGVNDSLQSVESIGYNDTKDGDSISKGYFFLEEYDYENKNGFQIQRKNLFRIIVNGDSLLRESSEMRYNDTLLFIERLTRNYPNSSPKYSTLKRIYQYEGNKIQKSLTYHKTHERDTFRLLSDTKYIYEEMGRFDTVKTKFYNQGNKIETGYSYSYDSLAVIMSYYEIRFNRNTEEIDTFLIRDEFFDQENKIIKKRLYESENEYREYPYIYNDYGLLIEEKNDFQVIKYAYEYCE